ISKTSFHYVEINRDTSDSCCVALKRPGSDTLFFRDTIESSPRRIDIARRVEAKARKEIGRDHVVWFYGESSQFRPLRIFPQTQFRINRSQIGRNLRVARVQVLGPSNIGYCTFPFTSAPINPPAKLSRQSIVGLPLQRAIKLYQRFIVLAVPPIEK